MFCIKDLLYIFLESGKYIVLYKRFIIYIYIVRKNVMFCIMDLFIVVFFIMRVLIIFGV